MSLLKIMAEASALLSWGKRSQFARKLPCLHLFNHAVITGDIITTVVMGTCPCAPNSKCKRDAASTPSAQHSSGELHGDQGTVTKKGTRPLAGLNTAAPQNILYLPHSSAWRGVTSLP